jgi:hypothetical protein
MRDQALRLEYVHVPEWPPLAWLARCARSGSTIVVFHGSRVETHDEWFCEAAWAGDYSAGGFDRTDIVAGSGGRLRGGELIFVSSGSTVDRLNALEPEGEAWVSNSLACLVASADANLSPSYTQYWRTFRSIVRGIKGYRPDLPTSAGSIRLVYFDNLVWDGRALSLRPKPGLGRDFSNFARVGGFLKGSMQGMAENMASPARRFPYRMLTTASSGYDSSTVTVLAHQAGCESVVCVDHDRQGDDDSGEPLARVLGMKVISIKSHDWRKADLPEVAFLASDSHGGDVFFKGAEAALEGTVLFTGFHGDKMWDKHPKDVSENIVRGDQSGLSLAEYRLRAGFIHCPVPFWGVRQIRDMCAVSRSPELEPWDVPGDYSRPICRRIVEEAGVPRDMFGITKKATWVQFIGSREFMCESSVENYMDWLRANRADWFKRGRVPPIASMEVDRLELAGRYWFRLDSSASSHSKNGSHKLSFPARVRAAISERPTRLRRHVFPWAVEHARKSYVRPF